MTTRLRSATLIVVVATALTACWGTPGRRLWLQNECGAPVGFIIGSNYDQHKDEAFTPIETGRSDVVAFAEPGDAEEVEVAVRWAGDPDSDKLITIPAEAWQTKEPDGDLDRDDLIATLSDDLCPEPVQ